MAQTQHVIVVGAGPVGVVAALACVQRGFKVTLLESADKADDSPRAATTHPSTLEYIEEVGLIEPFIQQGLVARYFQFWDRDSGRRIAQFDHELLKDDTRYPFVVQTEQHKLVRMGVDKLRTYPDAVAHFNARVTSLTQHGTHVDVSFEHEGETQAVKADYVVGSDGGRSTVRKLLGIEFEGFTWPERFTVLTTLHDFEKSGFCFRNYLAGTEAWANLFKVAGDDMKGRWRAVFPTKESESDEEALGDAAVNARLHGIDAKCRLEDVVHRNIYRVHQRVAQKFRSGRVFLAGDASHLNNPIGGLGLNCGVHDAIELANTLAAARERYSEDLLDRYERRRRSMNIDFIQEQTVNNKKRLEEKDPYARERRFQELRDLEADTQRQRQFLLRSSLIASVQRAESIA